MATSTAVPEQVAPDVYPVTVRLQAATENRNRLTTAFRFFLAIPHLILVGGPIAVIGSFDWGAELEGGLSWGSGGVLGVVACFVALFGWFAILVTGRYPEGLRNLAAFYLRWRVRAVSYLMLLRDEYPPFGDAEYPAGLVLEHDAGQRNRLTVFFRVILAIPHILLLCVLSLVWALTTAIAWVMILLTGSYPPTLYGFGIGVLAWATRVEAYLLLLRDEYPPFTLRA
jgi:hypothetical protein